MKFIVAERLAAGHTVAYVTESPNLPELMKDLEHCELSRFSISAYNEDVAGKLLKGPDNFL